MVQPPPLPEPTHARAVSTARGREALIDAALERSPATASTPTHTDHIAGRAGVSPRTFFRYFPTKESVVFHRDYWFMRSFAAAYLEQPAHAQRLRRAAPDVRRAGRWVRRAAHAHRDVPRRGRLVGRCSLGREQEHLADHAVTVSEAIARRRGDAEPDDRRPHARVVALALYQRALRRWLGGPRSRELAGADRRGIRAHDETGGPLVSARMELWELVVRRVSATSSPAGTPTATRGAPAHGAGPGADVEFRAVDSEVLHGRATVLGFGGVRERRVAPPPTRNPGPAPDRPLPATRQAAVHPPLHQHPADRLRVGDACQVRSYYAALSSFGLDHWGRYIDEFGVVDGEWLDHQARRHHRGRRPRGLGRGPGVSELGPGA